METSNAARECATDSQPVREQITLLLAEVKNISHTLSALRDTIHAKQLTSTSPEQAPKRISFLEDPHLITLDGKEIWLEQTGKQLLKLLHDKYPNWVGERERHRNHFKARPLPIFKNLPEEIQSLILRESGAGYRLTIK